MLPGAKIDGPAEPDIRLENARIGGADFAEIGVTGKDDPLARAEAPGARRSAPVTSRMRAASCVARKRRGLGIEAGEFPKLDRGARDHETTARVIALFGLRAGRSD